MRDIGRRLEKLEALRDYNGEIPIVVDDEADVPAAVERLITEGHIRPEDRARCVWIWNITTLPPGIPTHEEWLETVL